MDQKIRRSLAARLGAVKARMVKKDGASTQSNRSVHFPFTFPGQSSTETIILEHEEIFSASAPSSRGSVVSKSAEKEADDVNQTYSLKASSSCSSSFTSAADEYDNSFPDSVFVSIFMFLDASHLLLAGQVCARWRRLANHPYLWQRLCLNDGIPLGPGVERIFAQADGKMFWWRDVYRYGQTVQRNWAKGKYKRHHVPLVNLIDAITCLEFDNDQIVIGTRRHDLLLVKVPMNTTVGTFAAHMEDHFDTTGARIKPSLRFTDEHDCPILCMAFNSTISNLLITGDQRGSLVVWNRFTGASIQKITSAHEGGVATAILVDSNTVVTAGFDKKINIYSVVTVSQSIPQTEQKPIKWGRSKGSKKKRDVQNLNSDPDKTLAEGLPELSEAPRLHKSFPSTSSLAERLKGFRENPQTEHRQSTISSSSMMKKTISPSVKRISNLSAKSSKALIAKLYEKSRSPKEEPAHSHQVVELVQRKTLAGHRGDVYCLTALEGSPLLASGSMDHAVKIWNRATGDCIKTFYDHEDTVACITSFGKMVFSGSMDTKIHQYCLERDTLVHVYRGHTNWIKAVDVNDTWIVSGGWDQCIRVWNWHTHQLVHTYHLNSGPIGCLRMDGSAETIIAACRGEDNQNQIVVLDFGCKRKQ
ncbi:WD40-repeat-containing domain protein [Cladochytrium replicatum]|nr:WD40-repeat-containing domain protein [Cladochytrium replicatum]